MIRGGVLEMSTKEENLLLINEDILIEGFLNGIKSPKVTYLWSDFALVLSMVFKQTDCQLSDP